ncbi:MAG TPA: thymidine phosphorylase [Candidatus Competibacteraceae bacterium]|nr:thymidine phosphorylase [Candidatus Competibacteraceae bacterium]
MTPFLPQEIIRRKRDGLSLSPAEIEFMVQGMVDGSVGEGQIAALAMAIYFQGLNLAERIALTQAMTHSGDVLDWSDMALDGPLLDKHSTGGVGDKTSLILAPLVAACGGYVPMISGRGLGHTGGTLDKLDSIPGYRSTPDIDRFQQVVREAGCAIIGQTADLAPADRRFYAVRDVTATVESIGLITASILSKKLAEGLQGLVMDIKTGSGAFLETLEAGRALSESLVTVAHGAGLPTVALLTDMNQVLGHNAGNALEVAEAVAFLNGTERDSRLHELVLALGGRMLLLGGLANTLEQAHEQLQQALDHGHAAERFARMVHTLGGPADLLQQPERYLPRAAIIKAALPRTAGFVQRMDTRALGLAIVQLGGGRRQPSDSIDYAVGLSQVAQIGEWVDAQRPLALIHAADEAQSDRAIASVQEAILVAATPPPPKPLIYETYPADHQPPTISH